MLADLMLGFVNALQPFHLLMLFFAIVLGFFGGAMPGIGGTMLIVILLPVTFGMDPIPVFLLLTSMYAATAYSGSISAILYRIPGTPEAMATTFDGYALTQQGRAGEAMGLAMTSSAIGGIFGALFLFFLTAPLAGFALRFSSPEYFALAVLALTVVASLSGKNLIRGLIGVSFGLFVATIGIDTISGTARFSFGSSQLMSGLHLVPMMIGLFAISEIMRNVKRGTQLKQTSQAIKTRTKLFIGHLLKKCAGTIARSTILGAWIGVLPGVGGTTASLISYSEAVRWSKHPERFGKGAPEGVAAPESANNSAHATAFVPLFSLGIPGSATTALILGVFILHGLQPGPMMLTTEKELVYTIFAGLFLVNIMMMIFAKPFISLFMHTQKIPYSFFAPLIVIFCFLGTYTVRNSMFDIWVMLVFGLLGYFFEKVRIPLATVVLGIVLGPIAEEELRRSLIMSGGDFLIFFTRPISCTLLILALLSLLWPLIKKALKRNNTNILEQPPMQ